MPKALTRNLLVLISTVSERHGVRRSAPRPNLQFFSSYPSIQVSTFEFLGLPILCPLQFFIKSVYPILFLPISLFVQLVSFVFFSSLSERHGGRHCALQPPLQFFSSHPPIQVSTSSFFVQTYFPGYVRFLKKFKDFPKIFLKFSFEHRRNSQIVC